VEIAVNAAKLLYNVGLLDALDEISGDTKGIWIAFRRFETAAEIITVQEVPVQKARNSPIQRVNFLGLLLDIIKNRKA